MSKTVNHPKLLSVCGDIEEGAISQMNTCLKTGEAAGSDVLGAIMADAHLGYGMPIGGVLALSDHVSPTAVGYDQCCGVLAVKTPLKSEDVDIKDAMDQIWDEVHFGMGGEGPGPLDVDQEVILESIEAHPLKCVRDLSKTAATQLGTVGGGNHFVNLMKGEGGKLWIATHFGSRGFGHRLTTYFLDLLAANDDINAAPALIEAESQLGAQYLEAHKVASEYAYKGRDNAVMQVMRILGTTMEECEDYVHSHHNAVWKEEHFGNSFYVHRKGATPAWFGERGFVGSSMGGNSVIVRGAYETEGSGLPGDPSIPAGAIPPHLMSTVHGAGRQMSRTEARGKRKRRWTCSNRDCDWFQGHGQHKPEDGKCPECGNERLSKNWVQISEGAIDYSEVMSELATNGIEIRGGGADEAPYAYKNLDDVLAYHKGTIEVLETLKPLGCAMAD